MAALGMAEAITDLRVAMDGAIPGINMAMEQVRIDMVISKVAIIKGEAMGIADSVLLVLERADEVLVGNRVEDIGNNLNKKHYSPGQCFL